MSKEIVLRKFKDVKKQQEFSILTPFVSRTINIPTEVKFPLYVNGEMLSAKELKELGLEILEYTQDDLDAITYPAMYTANPDLAPRVRLYKSYLDGLELPYTATSDEITEAINGNVMLSDTEKLELGTSITTSLHDIEVNLTMMEQPGQTAWAIMPKLIVYLPTEDSAQSEETSEETSEKQ